VVHLIIFLHAIVLVSGAPIYFSTTSRTLKLKAFRGTSYIFPLRIFFSLSCTLSYFSTTSRKIEGVPWYILHLILFPLRTFFSLSCAPDYFSTTSPGKLKAFPGVRGNIFFFSKARRKEQPHSLTHLL
jgi:hypothetical protein